MYKVITAYFENYEVKHEWIEEAIKSVQKVNRIVEKVIMKKHKWKQS